MGHPCGACKYLGRTCTPECVFAPVFPAEYSDKFRNVHMVFGASNVAKMLSEIHPSRRQEAMDSVLFEAEARLLNPVYGSAGHVSHLYKQIQHLLPQLHAAKAKLSQYMEAAGVSGELPPSFPAQAASLAANQQQQKPPVAPSFGQGFESTASTEQQYPRCPGAEAANPDQQTYNYMRQQKEQLGLAVPGGGMGSSDGAMAAMEREQQFLVSQQLMAAMARRDQSEMIRNYDQRERQFLVSQQRMAAVERRDQSDMSHNDDQTAQRQFLLSQRQMAAMARREQSERAQNFIVSRPQMDEMARREQSERAQNFIVSHPEMAKMTRREQSEATQNFLFSHPQMAEMARRKRREQSEMTQNFLSSHPQLAEMARRKQSEMTQNFLSSHPQMARREQSGMAGREQSGMTQNFLFPHPQMAKIARRKQSEMTQNLHFSHPQKAQMARREQSGMTQNFLFSHPPMAKMARREQSGMAQNFLFSRPKMAKMARREQSEMTQNFLFSHPQMAEMAREQSETTLDDDDDDDLILFDIFHTDRASKEHGKGSVGITGGGVGGGSSQSTFHPSTSTFGLLTPVEGNGKKHREQGQQIVEPRDHGGMAGREQLDMTQNYDLNLFDGIQIQPSCKHDGETSVTVTGSDRSCMAPSMLALGLLTTPTEEDGPNQQPHRQQTVQPGDESGTVGREQSERTQNDDLNRLDDYCIGPAYEHAEGSVSINAGGRNAEGSGSVGITGGSSVTAAATPALGLPSPTEEGGPNHHQQQSEVIVEPGHGDGSDLKLSMSLPRSPPTTGDPN